MQPDNDERVLFFHTDTAEGRKVFGVPADQKMCDAVVFHRGSSPQPTVILAELKSCDCTHAVEQICATHSLLSKHFPNGVFPLPKWIALIVLAASAPGDWKKLRKRLPPDVELKILAGRKGNPVNVRELLK